MIILFFNSLTTERLLYYNLRNKINILQKSNGSYD